MIGYLRGQVLGYGSGFVLLQVGGIGFKVFVPANLRGMDKGELEVYTHLHIREDDFSLYGFASKEELEVFELLLGVSGIGPRLALGIISFRKTEELLRDISQEDVVRLSELPGIGKKTAQKMILELKDKIGAIETEPVVVSTSVVEDAILALMGLGYSRNEALGAVDGLGKEFLATSEDVLTIVQRALQKLDK